MRVEEYIRELIDAYGVMGSPKRDWDAGLCAPIKMSVTRSSQGYPRGYSLDSLIQLADCDDFRNEHRSEDDQEFCDHYVEIMRGNYPGWQLNAFKVRYGSLTLFYGKSGDSYWNFVRLDAASMDLYLTFETEKSRLGFVPTYNVRIHNSPGHSGDTEVEEDLGYIRRNPLRLLLQGL